MMMKIYIFYFHLIIVTYNKKKEMSLLEKKINNKFCTHDFPLARFTCLHLLYRESEKWKKGKDRFLFIFFSF